MLELLVHYLPIPGTLHMWEMYLFTFVLLSLSSNTQGTFGKINEKDE